MATAACLSRRFPPLNSFFQSDIHPRAHTLACSREQCNLMHSIIATTTTANKKFPPQNFSSLMFPVCALLAGFLLARFFSFISILFRSLCALFQIVCNLIFQVHPCGRYRHNTVVFILAKEFNLKNLRTIHRLDRLTSGLLLFGRSPKKARQMEHQIRNRQVQKQYMCRVEGNFPE